MEEPGPEVRTAGEEVSSWAFNLANNPFTSLPSAASNRPRLRVSISCPN